MIENIKLYCFCLCLMHLIVKVGNMHRVLHDVIVVDVVDVSASDLLLRDGLRVLLCEAYLL